MKNLTNLQKLLLDDVFWLQYRYVTMNSYRLQRFSEYRSKNKLPPRKMLESWIEEDYKFIKDDKRDNKEIMFWLISPAS